MNIKQSYEDASLKAYFSLPEEFRAVYENRDVIMPENSNFYVSERGSISPLQAIRMAVGFGVAYLTHRGTENILKNDTDQLVASGLAGIIAAGVTTLATRKLEKK